MILESVKFIKQEHYTVISFTGKENKFIFDK